jgi:hypothetical protein
MDVGGRLEIDVAGERWEPVPALADCGPEDPCYVVRVESDGSATIRFGDGVHGRPLPQGAQVQATYRSGNGTSGHLADGRSDDLAVMLMELLGYVGDRLIEMQDRVASEAYLETARERSSLPDIAGLRAVIAERPGDVQICVCFRPLGPPAETPGNVTPWRPSPGSG